MLQSTKLQYKLMMLRQVGYRMFSGAISQVFKLKEQLLHGDEDNVIWHDRSSVPEICTLATPLSTFPFVCIAIGEDIAITL